MKILPRIITENGVSTFLVDGKPFVALGGEIHNSSASNLEYMEENVWPFVKDLNINTLIVPVSWELVESIENSFDFEIVDGIIKQARRENVRLVLLWFGLWKNSESDYVPSWVKKDFKKYFRARYTGNIASNTISPLCDAAVKADAKAFRSLMRHIKAVDVETNTVIMIQVENEIGFLKSERDYSELANAEFEKDVPPVVASEFAKNGNWKDVFGEDACEYFMAYYYAKAVEQIANEGSNEYPIPMYVNAWLEQYPHRPGSYPSGGPIAKVMKMWRAVAPSICLYAPDIYLADFIGVCNEYTDNDNPLFIPEARQDVSSAANVFYAIGKHNALGFCPFGIEDLANRDANKDENGPDMAFLMALNIDFTAMVTTGTSHYLGLSYKLLGNMMGVINQYRSSGKMTGFLQSNNHGCLLSFSAYDLHVKFKNPSDGKPKSGGLIIEVSENEFIFAGTGFNVEFLPKRGESNKVGYIKIEEGRYEKERWIGRRILNGDEGRVSVGRTPSIVRAEVYKYI